MNKQILKEIDNYINEAIGNFTEDQIYCDCKKIVYKYLTYCPDNYSKYICDKINY